MRLRVLAAVVEVVVLLLVIVVAVLLVVCTVLAKKVDVVVAVVVAVVPAVPALPRSGCIHLSQSALARVVGLVDDVVVPVPTKNCVVACCRSHVAAFSGVWVERLLLLLLLLLFSRDVDDVAADDVADASGPAPPSIVTAVVVVPTVDGATGETPLKKRSSRELVHMAKAAARGQRHDCRCDDTKADTNMLLLLFPTTRRNKAQ
mmetsp:Transcript_16826/g.46213  ORF Transcript_16826/g.46213 Transcript_16826/m.46213 type:complete len:204 (-) Transcript_16826:475-1086(-)